MKLVCVSDTHNTQLLMRDGWLPEGDVLVHAGDHTMRGSTEEMDQALEWLASFKSRFEHIVVIAGNHDFCAESKPEIIKKWCAARGLTYLHDEEVVIDGKKFYGSPYQPWFHDWAFNLERGPELKKKWALIPEDSDVVITHGPPVGQGDIVMRGGFNVGCMDLWDRLLVVKPKYHIFGHIHEAYGVFTSEYNSNTTFINASICTLSYHPDNEPVVVEL